MKHLIYIAMFVALFGCDKMSPEPMGSDSTTSTGEVIGEKGLSYLDDPLTGKVNQRGLYRMVRSGGVANDSDTTTGKVVLSPVIQLVESTERIPLMKGAQMYLQYRLWPFPNLPAHVDLRRVLKHPEMTLPDGSTSTGSDFLVKRRVSGNQVIVYTGYGFNEDYELVEGNWIFEIWYQDKKLIEQTFSTYWPDEEEIASLAPVLALGNEVQTRMETPGYPDASRNWPRVVVGEESRDEPTGVSEVKRQMKESLKIVDQDEETENK